MAPRLKLTVLLLPWFVVIMLVCRTHQQQVTFVIQPQDMKIIEGSAAVFTCEITTTEVGEIKWYRWDTVTGGGSQVKDVGRFEISEITGKIAQNLNISKSILSDSAYYFCTYGNQSKSTLGRLDVLPSTWLPLCSQTLGTGKLSIGERFELACTSTGHVNTSLVWSVRETPVDNFQVIKDQELMKVTSFHSSMIGTSDALVYTCEASLDGLFQQESCTVLVNYEYEAPLDIIPYIVVGLMSLIAVLLFFVVLLILFRHRQCRICQQVMQEPHTVLDAASLQSGSWVPPPPVAIDVDVESSESSEDRVSEKDTQIHHLERGTNQPPDVVPVLEPVEVPEIGDQPSSSSEVVPETEPADSSEPVPKAEPGPTTELKPKTKNLTLTKNIDKNIEQPEKIVEKKEIQFPAHKTRGTRRPRDKKVKHYKEPPVKAKMKEKEPIYVNVKKLNVPPKSAQGGSTSADAVPSTSAGATAVTPPDPPPRPSPDSESKDTSSTTTNSSDQTPGVNDLGRGDSKKKRVKHYRKKSEDVKRNSHPEDTVLNIPAATNSTSESPSAQPKSSPKVPADRVIYAELDFSKNVGPNII